MRYFYYVFFIFLVSCCYKTKVDKDIVDNKEKSKEHDFKIYIKSLSKIKLPLIIGTHGLDYKNDNKYDTYRFEKFKYNLAQSPYGLLYCNGSIVSIIDVVVGDEIVPAIMTYNYKGEKLDSLMPYIKSGWDIDSETSETVYINSITDIYVVDFSKHWGLDEKSKRIANTLKVKVDTTYYRIYKNGKIEKGKRN